jgi:hypothetical protein
MTRSAISPARWAEIGMSARSSIKVFMNRSPELRQGVRSRLHIGIQVQVII